MVDAKSGDIVASRVEAGKGMRVAAGMYDGVDITDLDDREAVGMAAQGRCVVFTCPPASCAIDGSSAGPLRVFFQRGGGVHIVEFPTKAPAGVLTLSGGSVGGGDHHDFDDNGIVRYTQKVLPVAFPEDEGRDVINAVLNVVSWVARCGVSVHTPGRPSRVEAAKGALLVVCDAEKLFAKKVSRPGRRALARVVSLAQNKI